MKTISALGSDFSISVSALKRTHQAQVAATKSFPKTAALIRKLSERIKLLKKQALKSYFKRKKDDAAAEAHKKMAHGAPHKAHSSVIIAEDLQERLLDRSVDISDEDLAECCADTVSESAVSVEPAGDKKKEAAGLKKTLKANPKAAKRKRQMSAAMRIRENKKLRIEIKKLLEMKKKLQDKAWGLYVKKVGSKKADKPVENTAKPIEKTVKRVATKAELVDKMKKSGKIGKATVRRISGLSAKDEKKVSNAQKKQKPTAHTVNKPKTR